MAETWLSCEDTAKLMNISARTVLRMAKAEEIPSRRKRGASQRNGKPTIEYSTRLLPVELQYQAEKQNRDRAPDRDARATAEQHGGQLALWAPAGSNVEAIRRPVTPIQRQRFTGAIRHRVFLIAGVQDDCGLYTDIRVEAEQPSVYAARPLLA